MQSNYPLLLTKRTHAELESYKKSPEDQLVKKLVTKRNIGETLSISTYNKPSMEKIKSAFTLAKKPVSETRKPVPAHVWQWKTCDNDTKKILMETNENQSCSSLNTKNLSHLEIKITMEKGFMHNAKLGWNWHKGWNIPAIFLTSAKLANYQTNEVELSDKLRIKIQACKFAQNDKQELKLYDVGLIGTTTHLFHGEKSSLTGLKFSTTSHSNEGLNFHLFISLMHVNDACSSTYELVETYMSPAIFVDARKSSREPLKTKKLKQIMKYFEPFHPKLLRKDYVKKKPTTALIAIEKSIDNNIRGLCDYLTAANIKNKVKHPLFLMFKFSQCVKVYYNTNKIRNAMGFKTFEDAIVCQLQSIFYSIQTQYLTKLRPVSTLALSAVPMEEKKFIFLFQDSDDINPMYFTKAVSEYIEPLKHDLLHVSLKDSPIPYGYKLVDGFDLEKAYKNIFPYLLKLKSQRKPSVSVPLETSSIESESTPVKIQPEEEIKEEEVEDMVVKCELQMETTKSFSTVCSETPSEALVPNPLLNNYKDLSESNNMLQHFLLNTLASQNKLQGMQSLPSFQFPHNNGGFNQMSMMNNSQAQLHGYLDIHQHQRNEQLKHLEHLQVSVTKALTECANNQLEKDKFMLTLVGIMGTVQELTNSYIRMPFS